MSAARCQASLPVVAFALLCATLAAVGALPARDATAAALAVALAYLPSGWVAPAGWRRRAAEAAMLPAAMALVLVGDPTLQRMAVPPLLVGAALAAAAAAIPRAAPRERAALVVALALAVRGAGAMGLAGFPKWQLAAVVVAVGVLAWTAAARTGPRLGMVAALLAGALPLERAPLPWLAAVVVLAGLLAAVPGRLDLDRIGAGWLPGALAVALVASALATWGGIAPVRAFPAAGAVAVVAGVACVAAAPWLPAAAAGAGWLAATLALGPTQPPPPDMPSCRIDAAHPRATLTPGDGRPYLLESASTGGAALADRAVVATVHIGDHDFLLEAGDEVAIPAGAPGGAALATLPVWRPGGVGRGAVRGVAGRAVLSVPDGVAPVVELGPRLPDGTGLWIATAGPSRPSPPRDWPLPAWLAAAAAAVALVQLLGRSWSAPGAGMPWALLAAGSLAARMPVEPLHLLAERHAIDLALAAFLLAWLPPALRWLARGRTFVAAAALLVPLAVATPHLTPPIGDENYHLLLLTSLKQDHDLDLANNFDLRHDPQDRIYLPFAHRLLHSPVLALATYPGYELAGRTGAILLVALAGAGLLALLLRAAGRLGVGRSRRRLAALALLLGYPLATFATQLWVELPGALLAALALAWIAAERPRPWLVALATAAAIALKTRLGLVLVPLLAAAWWPRRWRWRDLRLPALVGLAAAGGGLALAWAMLGDPLDPLGRRTLASLLPHSAAMAVSTLGGLAFDPAGGLLFAAPLGLIALAGVARLWREGGRGERALLVGAAATLIPLLNLAEWRGGDAPPARYLVPLLPAAALAGMLLLARAARWRPLAWIVLPPTLLVGWVFVTRPHLAVDTGEGGFWLADALARRFAADARHLFPSFLRPSTATWTVPLAVLALATAAAWLANVWPGAARAGRRAAVAIWLLAAAGTVAVLTARFDRVVELEDPQVVALGGKLEPPEGTFARFTVPNGWRLADGEAVEVPLHLASGSRLRLEGWAEGAAGSSGAVIASWPGAPPVRIPLTGWPRREVMLPAPSAGGRLRLRLSLSAPGGGEAVLDRLVVVRP
ncbi:MAG TPA: hypothetical protein VLW17_11885 [Thermoanaerobaculaceae bacterium]|nr:hypothetical protein [Thermoanaerobaculaceae bacterium]